MPYPTHTILSLITVHVLAKEDLLKIQPAGCETKKLKLKLQMELEVEVALEVEVKVESELKLEVEVAHFIMEICQFMQVKWSE